MNNDFGLILENSPEHMAERFASLTPDFNWTCGTCGGPSDLLSAGSKRQPCLGCCKARRAAAMDGKCHCGQRKCIPGGEQKIGSRRWIPCDRCLGTIEQLS